MLHSGDHFEVRARAARNQELRRLTRALSGFLFKPAKAEHRQFPVSFEQSCANDISAKTERAA